MLQLFLPQVAANHLSRRGIPQVLWMPGPAALGEDIWLERLGAGPPALLPSQEVTLFGTNFQRAGRDTSPSVYPAAV